MRPLTLRLHDRTRGRALETVVRLPDTAAGPAPLIVFGHGFYGHPRKFAKLLGALVTLEGGLHEQLFEDEAGPHAAAVDTTTAFWRLFLNGDARARAALSSRPSVRVEAEL